MRDYKLFKDKHKGEKIIVSGCGTSASLIQDPQSHTTIGVNDLSRLYSPNYLVVLNDKRSFEADRWKWIEGTSCDTVFTHIKGLAVPDEKRVVLQLGRYGGFDLNKDAVDYTSNSTYVACIIAAYMGASKIGLIGVDFTPNHFFGNTGEHALVKKLNVINEEYAKLDISMKAKGIEFVNLSPESRIRITKQNINDF